MANVYTPDKGKRVTAFPSVQKVKLQVKKQAK